MFKAGMIGAGYIAESHARGYAALNQVELAMIVDHDLEKAQKLAGQYHAKAERDIEAILNSDIDLVSICTPTPSHANIALAVLRAGKHVLCEKPIARTLEEAELMISCATENKVKLMIGHVSRYEADHLKAKQILDSGELGRLRMASHAITGPYPGWSAGDWLGDHTRSGGPVIDLAIHSVDYLTWCFQSPVIRVYATGNRHGSGQDHYVLINLAFANGGLGLVEASWAHPKDAPLTCRVELCAEKGRIAWNYDQITGMQAWITGTGSQSYVMEGENSFAAQIEDFLHSIETDLPVPVPGMAGLEALRVCLAALESMKSGRCIELNPTIVKERSEE